MASIASSSSSISAYPGLSPDTAKRLEPKSPGYNSLEGEEWHAWRHEIKDLVNFLLEEAPPKHRRSSREIIRSGSKQLRHLLRVRQHDRFCHIAPDPVFLKDMENSSMYLINCNARALNRGHADRTTKHSFDWRDTDFEPDIYTTEGPRIARKLSKRVPLGSHPSRGYSCTVYADSKHDTARGGFSAMLERSRYPEAARPARFSVAKEPMMRGALAEQDEPRATGKSMLEVRGSAFEPFAVSRPTTAGNPALADEKTASPQARKQNDTDLSRPNKLGVENHSPASSVVYLPSMAPPTVPEEPEPISRMPTPDISHGTPQTASKSPNEGHKNRLKKNMGRANPPSLVSNENTGLDSGTESPVLPQSTGATSPSAGQLTPSSTYAAAETAWSANATLARRRLASRADSTRRVKQRDCDRSRAAACRVFSDTDLPSVNRTMERDTDISHALAVPSPPSLRHLKRTVSYDAVPARKPISLDEAISNEVRLERARPKEIMISAKPTKLSTSRKTSSSPPTNRLSQVVTIAEQAPFENALRSRVWSGSSVRTMYRSRGTQCYPEQQAATTRARTTTPTKNTAKEEGTTPCNGTKTGIAPNSAAIYRGAITKTAQRNDTGDRLGAPRSTNNSTRDRGAGPNRSFSHDATSCSQSLADRTSMDMFKLETRLETQLAVFDKRTKMLESLLIAFVGNGAASEALLSEGEDAYQLSNLEEDRRVLGRPMLEGTGI